MIGDSLDYIIGDSAQIVMSKENPNQLSKWGNLILKKPRAIPFVIFLFALTPLPDSLLLVPLGMVKYSFKKTLFYMYCGKVGMMVIVAIAGIIGFQFLLDLLGSEGSWITGMLLMYLVWLIMTLMIKINPKSA
jgi:membrane protein YqaA with SNARE-associated domain